MSGIDPRQLFGGPPTQTAAGALRRTLSDASVASSEVPVTEEIAGSSSTMNPQQMAANKTAKTAAQKTKPPSDPAVAAKETAARVLSSPQDYWQQFLERLQRLHKLRQEILSQLATIHRMHLKITKKPQDSKNGLLIWVVGFIKHQFWKDWHIKTAKKCRRLYNSVADKSTEEQK